MRRRAAWRGGASATPNRGRPAGRAGLQRGDLLVRAGERPLTSVDDLFDALDAADAVLELGVVRGSDERDVAVTLQ